MRQKGNKTAKQASETEAYIFFKPHAAFNIVLLDTVRSLNNTVGSHNKEKAKRDGVCADRRRRQKKSMRSIEM